MTIPARSLAVGLLVTWASGTRAGPGIILSPALGSRTQLTVNGRALAEAPAADGSKLGRNVRRLTASPWEGAFLELKAFNQTRRIHSGHDGEFSVIFDAPP